MFFIAAALVLTTAGVFAGKAKFATIPNVYAYNGTSAYELLNGTITEDQLSTSGTTAASISGAGTFGLYTYNTTSGVYSRLYATGF